VGSLLVEPDGATLQQDPAAPTQQAAHRLRRPARAGSQSPPMHNAPQHHWQPAGPGLALVLAGDWRVATAGTAHALGAPPQAAAPPERVVLRSAALEHWDGHLAALLHEALAPLAHAGVPIDLGGLPQGLRGVLELSLSAAEPPRPEPADGGGALAAFGRRVARGLDSALTTAAFLGRVVLGLGRLLRGRSTLPVRELLRCLDEAGPLSIPIVTLTCFLVGLMLAYMGGHQLARIGAPQLIADVVTVGMVRELAGLMTGVILSGRLGAAYAAQIGSMQAGEEIDALRALGVDPIDHLVLPRLLALVTMAPLLIVYGMVVGVLAGLPAAVWAYGVTAGEYLSSCLEALSWTHLWIGLFKGLCYAALVALAGCREGLQAGRDAQAVGAATTTAVVKALVWIVAAAATTTIVFQSLDL
jgi:phospholipid/cholesterol/gamma-HCH transport system permease protein